MDVWYTDGHNQVLQLVSSFCVLVVRKPTLCIATLTVLDCVLHIQAYQGMGAIVPSVKTAKAHHYLFFNFFVVTRSRSMVEITC